ncbi:MAG: Ig-like domain-containing protein, partial [Bacteroidota bacterium]
MKKGLLLLVFLATAIKSFSQLSISMATGTPPTVPTGWVLGGSATATTGETIQLTNNVGSLTGRAYYNTLTNLTGCGQFSVDFDFQIIPTSASFAVADGISFFFINPLTAFTAGGGLGLPNPLTGFVLALDPYDNDGDLQNPQIEMFGYSTASTYGENDVTHRLSALLGGQAWMSDGNWHHVRITYNGGNINVYLNWSPTPSSTGYFPITTSGYFGFTASTGGAYSTQSIRNVYINSNTISPIVGPTTICSGPSVTYSDATAGGTWSSSNTTVATIGSSTGVVSGLSAGTTNITYYYSSTCQTSITVTVNPADVTITGTGTMCPGAPVTFTNATSGGTWSSSNTSIATVGSTTGVVTGVSMGTAVISYLLPAGCYGTKAVTVSIGPPPLTITPSPVTVCNNSSVLLTATYTPATFFLMPKESWENGVPTVAGTPVDGWNYIGTSNYWTQANAYTVSNPIITGPASGVFLAMFKARTLASGLTATLYSPSFSMTGLSTAQLTFYVYRDVSAYNTATYDLEGINVYVNTTPSLTGATSLGYVPRRGGLGITGPLTGTSTTGTSGWQLYSVNIPAIYTGSTNYILFNAVGRAGNNIYLDSIALNGTPQTTWSPTTHLYTDAAFAIPYTTGTPAGSVYVHPTTVTTATSITYTAAATSAGCTSSATGIVSINPSPAAITGSSVVCQGFTTPLSDATPGGTWSSSNTAIATIGSSSGILSGVAVGTATITYSGATCYALLTITVNTTPPAITGTAVVCVGATTTLANTLAGGTWSSSNVTVATVSTSGVVSGLVSGTSAISYALATGCYAVRVVTVNPLPNPITGTLSVCVGLTTTLSSTTGGGIWSSSATGTATVGVGTGIVTGMAAGTAIISYRVSGCNALATVNVLASPPPVTGTALTCVGSTTTLSHASAGGTWSSTNIAVATIGATTGVVTGLTVGTTTITYSLGAGCVASTIVTVTATPPVMTGTLAVCQLSTTTLAHSTAGGTWLSSNTGVATISSGGVVAGISGGTSTITYTLPSGCYTTAVVTVNPLPAIISGSYTMCAGALNTLSSTTSGISWSSSNTSVATVGATTGVVTGIAGGTTNIVTTITATGCLRTITVTVNPLPAAIGGILSVCPGLCTTLTDATAGGTWSISSTTIATVGASGVVCGVSAGTATVTYTAGTGCYRTATVTVNIPPAAIGGPTAVCFGYTITMTNATGG